MDSFVYRIYDTEKNVFWESRSGKSHWFKKGAATCSWSQSNLYTYSDMYDDWRVIRRTVAKNKTFFSMQSRYVVKQYKLVPVNTDDQPTAANNNNYQTIGSAKTPPQILEECVALQRKKGNDYQNKSSGVRQADYYLNGISTIYDIMHAKMLRIKSVMDAIQCGQSQNFESLEDSCVDLINYTSFMASYMSGGIDGQSNTRDMFNKAKAPSNDIKH